MPKIVGILNLTPDSFSGDGAERLSKSELCKRIENMIDEGADIIDVGAESTAPNSKDVSVKEELKRLESIFDVINKKKYSNTIFSIDTRNSETAKKGIQAGAKMINDVSGGRNDKGMFKVVADSRVKYVMMHCKNPNGKADLIKKNKDIFSGIIDFFDKQIETAVSFGIKKEDIILDPGMGAFVSPNAEDSIEILRRIPELKKRYNLPIYIGASRKGFLSKLVNKDFGVKDRVGASLATALFAVNQGANYVRVHDILETKQIIEAWEVLKSYKF